MAVGAVVALVTFFNGRDSSTTSASDAGPGLAGAPPAHLAPVLRTGNLVVLAPPASLSTVTALARDVAGDPPDSAALRRAGQAIEVHAALRATAIGAYAYHRVLRTSVAADPQLRAFLEYWLGRGAQK